MIDKKWVAALTGVAVLPLTQLQMQSGEAVSTAAPAGVVIAATGTSGQALTMAAGSRSWRNLGGAFTSRPAVTNSNGQTHFFASRKGGVLMHRTSGTPWHRLTQTPCNSPSAAAYGGTVRVVCVGPRNNARAMTFPGRTTKPFRATLVNLGGNVSSVAVMSDAAGYSIFSQGPRYRSRSGKRSWTSNTYVKYQNTGWRHWDTYSNGPLSVTSSSKRVFLSYQVGKQVLVEVFDWTLPRTSPNFYTYWWLRTTASGSIGLAPTGDGSNGVLAVRGTDARIRTIAITKKGTSGSWNTLPGRVRAGVSLTPTTTYTPPPAPPTGAPTQNTPPPSESTPSRPPTESAPPPPSPVTTTVTRTVTPPPPPSTTTSAPPPSSTTAPPPATTTSPTSAPSTTVTTSAPATTATAAPSTTRATSATGTGTATTTSAPAPSSPDVTINRGSLIAVQQPILDRSGVQGLLAGRAD